MNETALFFATLLKELLKARFSGKKKKAFAAVLIRIYMDGKLLVENGRTILSDISKRNRGGRIDLEQLLDLLYEQRVLVRRIESSLRKKAVTAVLSVRFPSIAPIGVLVSAKGRRIEVLIEEIVPHSADQHRARYESLLRDRRIGARLKLPNESAIRRSRKALREIDKKLEDLRQFICTTFELTDML